MHSDSIQYGLCMEMRLGFTQFDTMAKLSDLKTSRYQRNQHPPEQIERLAKIMRESGVRHPIHIHREYGEIAFGHGRKEAALLNGWSEYPIVYQDFKDDTEYYLCVQSDNAIASWSDLDLSKINFDLQEMGPFDIQLLGLKNFEIEPADKYAPGCDEDEIPEVKDTRVKLGDLWQLGEHRLMCGDSTSIDAVESLMAGEKADMVFTDPPYNVASDSKNFAKKISKAMNDLANADWDKNFKIEPALNTLIPVCADSVTIYIWTSHFLINDIWKHLNEWCDFTNYCVWNKPNPMPSLSKRHWTWSTELCVYGTRGSKRKVNFPDQGHASNVWSFTKKSDGSHPTQKPIEVCEHPIKFSSDQGQNILDLFGGSGSTLIACEKTNRKCFMMELDPHYCDVIVARWEKYTGKLAERIVSPGQ